jgi:hypothetical protein
LGSLQLPGEGAVYAYPRSDTSIPDLVSDTMAGILEALAVKPDGEDLLVAVVR